MSKIVKCPICNNTTNITYTSTCVYCGQRLKKGPPDEDNWNSGNKSKPKKSGCGCGCFTILIILLGVFLLRGYIKGLVGENLNTSIEEIKDSVVFTISENFNIKESEKTNEDNKENENTKIIEGKKLSRLTDTTTDNSTVEYNVKFNDGTKWVWFKVSKDHEVKNQVIPVDNGVMKGNLYLTFGPGQYNVKVLTSTSNDRQDYFYEIKDFIVNNEDKRDMRHLMPSEYVESNSPEIINLAKKITKGCSSDMKKTRAIHDWVATNIAYDVDALYSGNIKIYSALDTLSGKKAVCSGYANLTAALNRAVGIKTKIIHGEARNGSSDDYIGHAWNEMYIDDKWIIQDTTWDAGGVSRNGKFVFQLDHKYFDPNPKVFNKTHIKDEETEY